MAHPRPVRWLHSHTGAADGMLAAAVAAISLVFHLTYHHAGAADPRWFSVVLTVGATLPIAVRRRRPVTALVVVLACQMALEVGNFQGAGWSGVLVAAYSLGAYVHGRRQRRVGAAGLVAVVVLVVAGVLHGDAPWQALISTPVTFVSAMVVGDNVRRRRVRAAELVERAERAERERGLVAQQHVLDERARIARELHDVVAHSISLMVIQAGAARRQLDHDPSRAAEAMAVVEDTGRRAMNEMRHILGLLRGDGVTTVPQPSLTGLDELLAEAGDLPLHLRAEGELADLPAGLGVSAYRIVQEALTNVRRHAGPVRRVDVAVVRDGDRLLVEVADDGRGASADVSTSPGFGLAGMRERVAAYGGALTAGPRAGGGWRVRAMLPVVTA